MARPTTFQTFQAITQGNPIVEVGRGPTSQFQRLFNTAYANSLVILDKADTALTGLDSKVDKTTEVIAGAGLTDGGPLSSDVTLNVGAGVGITVNANDVAIDTTAEAERIRDVIGVALVGGTGITVTPNDGADTITIACTVAGYTDEQAQDAVGNILTDSATVDFAYNDGAGTITASIVAGSIGPTELTDTAVSPGTYGDSTHVAQFTVDQDGRITAASNVAVSGGSGGSWIPLVDGSEPPAFITDGAGVLILVAGP